VSSEELNKKVTELEVRLAVAEGVLDHFKNAFDSLKKTVEDHMKSEEEDRRILEKLLNSIQREQIKFKAYLIGGSAVLSTIWGVGITILSFYLKVK